MTDDQSENSIDWAAQRLAPIWKPGRSYTYVLVAANEKILGEVGSNFAHTGYYASVGKKRLGEYYTESGAKAAVEAAVKEE